MIIYLIFNILDFNRKILGVTIDNIVLDGFCWSGLYLYFQSSLIHAFQLGNPFGLVNNTFYINSTLATGFDIQCNDPPRWRQCAGIILYISIVQKLELMQSLVTGTVALAL